jgi:hypothetical protein
MKKTISQAIALLIGFLALVAIIGCGGGGGGGGTPPPTAPSITTASPLPDGVRGQFYSVLLHATGGTTPYGWSATGLPPGMSLDAATGVLSGTPTATGTSTPMFTVTDSNTQTGSKQLSIVINPPPPPSVSTTFLPSGVQNQAYSATLSATSGTPPYTWSVTAGSLPAGVNLNGTTGALSGAPTATGTSTPTFTVTDNNSQTGSKQLSIVINPPSPPSVSTAFLPSGVQNQAYSATLSATGGTPPYTWSVTAGSLPAGVNLNGTTGALSGTPTATGTSNPTFTVTDSNTQTGNKQLSIVINPPDSPVIITSALPAGARTEPYLATLSATGGTPPYTWSVTAGSLPAGVNLNGTTGALSGTPSEEGTFSPEFTVTDSATIQALKSLDLRIAKPLALYVADFSTPTGAINVFDNASVANGASAWTRRLEGSNTTLDNSVGGPPAGMSYDADRKILYVARFKGSSNGAVLAFNSADTVTGNAAPNRIIQSIQPIAFALTSPSDVFIDSGSDRLYIADVTGTNPPGVILILTSASTTPQLLKGFSFGYGPPAAISVDVGRDILYVVPSQGTGIVAYDNVSDVTGTQRTITIGGMTGVELVDVKIDPATDTAYVADYNGGRVFVINYVSQKNGTYPPDRTLTGLTNPNSVFPDVANNRLFVSNRDGAGYAVLVVENMSSVNGTISFSRQLSGFDNAGGMTGYYR